MKQYFARLPSPSRQACLPFVLAALVLPVIACAGPAPSDVGSEQGSPEPAEPTGEARATEAASATGCPDLGGPSESYDAAGTPLLFDFRYPAGFQVSKEQDMGTLYQLDLRRDVEIDGRGRQIYFSIIQGLRELDSEVPAEIRMARERPDSPRVQAMAELMPEPAGEIDFGGGTVPLFRVDTESKTVYKFHLPHGGGYYSVNVEFAPSLSATECLEEMRRVAGEWVGGLTPNPAAEL